MNINIIEQTPILTWKNDYKNIFKQEFSEVFTPYKIAKEMIELIPQEKLINKNIKYLDAGCGCGNLSIVLYKYIYTNLNITNNRREYILNNMIYLLEVNDKRIENIKTILPCKNIIHIDFLKYKKENYFDIVISNPPFIITNKDSKNTIWPFFLRKCIDCLKDNGLLCILIPSLWMKPEHEMYNYITNYKIHKIKCFKNNEANNLFDGNARTPICYMLIEKKSSDNIIEIFNNNTNNYKPFKLNNIPIPMYHVDLINHLYTYVNKYGSLKNIIYKTNCPSKKVKFNNCYNNIFKFENIKTCIIKKDKPELIINYSDTKLKYFDKRKVILANKMYGIPYYDKDKKYGISSRDNYVYIDEDDIKCRKIYSYLKTKLIIFLYETTRYRMCYLEKYVFEFIPNILNIPIYEINDENIYKLFNISESEIKNIEFFLNKTRIKFF